MNELQRSVKLSRINFGNEFRDSISTICTLLCVWLLVSCGTGKLPVTSIGKLPHMDLIAWNEDTLHPVKIGFAGVNHFYYLLQDSSGLQKDTYIQG